MSTDGYEVDDDDRRDVWGCLNKQWGVPFNVCAALDVPRSTGPTEGPPALSDDLRVELAASVVTYQRLGFEALATELLDLILALAPTESE